MTIAANGLNATRLLSLSSTSATAYSPAPKRTAPSHPGTFAPLTQSGSKPHSASTCPSIAVTVDLPQVPATATRRFCERAAESAAARCVTLTPNSRARRRSRFVSSIAVETITSSGTAPPPRLPSSGRQRMPSPSRKRMFAVARLRSEPLTSWPCFASTVASALMPTPPTPIRWIFIAVIKRGGAPVLRSAPPFC